MSGRWLAPDPVNRARRPLAAALVGAILSFGTGCSASDYAGEIEQRRQRWRELAIEDYAYTFREACACEATGELVRLVVHDGRLSSSSAGSGSGGTIDDLFGLMLDYARRNPDELGASYDDMFRYPARFRVDPDVGTSDDEWAFLIECFSLNTDECGI